MTLIVTVTDYAHIELSEPTNGDKVKYIGELTPEQAVELLQLLPQAIADTKIKDKQIIEGRVAYIKNQLQEWEAKLARLQP